MGIKILQNMALEFRTSPFLTIMADETTDLFWLKVNQRANNLGIEGPQLPRLHKRPRRFDEGSSEGNHHENSKSLFRQHY